jgi:Tfp pilus assembly protein PilF
MRFTSKKRRERNLAATTKRGRELFVEGSEEDALSFLEEAVSRFPADAELRLLYASILLAFRPDEVVAEAMLAANLGRGKMNIQVRAGQILVERGEVDAAKDCLYRVRKASGSGITNRPGLENLEGLVAAREGEPVVAEERLRGATERDPEIASFALDLAQFLDSEGRFAEAIAVIDQSLDRVENKERLRNLRTQIVARINDRR